MEELLEDRGHLRSQIFVHDQVTAMGLSVEAEEGDLDSAQLPRLNGAAGIPARAEIGGGNGPSCGRG
jgi:hypothetical protein